MGGWVGGWLLLPFKGEDEKLGVVLVVERRKGDRTILPALQPVDLGRWVGGWVGGWVGWMEEKAAVRMSYCELYRGRWEEEELVGGVEDMSGWVGGWVGRRTVRV